MDMGTLGMVVGVGLLTVFAFWVMHARSLNDPTPTNFPGKDEDS